MDDVRIPMVFLFTAEAARLTKQLEEAGGELEVRLEEKPQQQQQQSGENMYCSSSVAQH